MASIYFMKARKKYVAQVNRDGVRHYLGLFDTSEEARNVAEQFEGKLPQNNPAASPPTQPELTQARVRELFKYDPQTGLLFWKARTSRRINVGDVAGYNTSLGYIAVRVDGKLHLAHRIVWMYWYGKFPDEEIDHIDGNGRNNAINNLRECSRSENGQNITLRKDNKLGATGVSRVSGTGKFKAEITVNGQTKRLGLFDSLEQAKTAYANAKKMHHTFNPVQRDVNG